MTLWTRHILWIDGLAALSAGVFVLACREWLAGLYALPPTLVTVIGGVNVAYSAGGLTLARWTGRRPSHVAALAAANAIWTIVCIALAIRVASEATPFGLAHLLGEGAFVAGLAAIEWRTRFALSVGRTPSSGATRSPGATRSSDDGSPARSGIAADR